MKTTFDYRSALEARLSSLGYGREGLEGLYEPVRYGLEGGGKRLRPVMMLMSCEAYGGNMEDALDAACGIEMYHNFTLLHDDVMDNSDMRRGRETVHRKWDMNTAILSGDVMLTLATELMMQVDDGILRGVLDRFNRMAVEIDEGQRLDMDFEKRDLVTVEEYIRMITLKTGALLGTSAAIGAMIAGASKTDCDRIEEFGRALGVAFQIQDDYLDVFGDPATFGKPIGGDINNGKQTFLLLDALSQQGPDAVTLAEAMKLPAGDSKVRVVRSVYERMGVDARCRKSILHWTGRALRALKKSNVSEEGHESFKALADKLIERKK